MRIAVIIPGTPLLVEPAVGVGDTHVATLRVAVHHVLDSLTQGSAPLAVVGSDPRLSAQAGPIHYEDDAPDGLQGFGFAVPGRPHRTNATTMPTSLAVARYLLEQRALTAHVDYWGVPESGGTEPADALAATLAHRHNVVVVADGSAKCGPKPPMGTHAEADATEQRRALALHSAQYDELATISDADAKELHIPSRLAWRCAAVWAHNVFGNEKPDTQVLYSKAPFGVGYHVARWQETASTPMGN